MTAAIRKTGDRPTATLGYRPRSVFCVIDGEYRNLDRAQQVANGHFDLAGTALELGTRPDWLGAPFPADEEWRIELSKFYYGLDLAHGFRQTGDRWFVDAWLNLVTSWIEQVSIEHDPTDVIARRLQNWTYAWDRFATENGRLSPIDPAASQLLLSSIGAQVGHLRDNLAAERNHRTLELYSLFITALAHPVLDPTGELLRFACFELDRNLRADILADGVHRERSTHYHAIALRSFVGARINAERFGFELPNGFDDRLGAAADFLATVLRPDGSLPMLSDSDDGDYQDLLGLLADQLHRPDLQWVATHGKEGEPPTEIDRSFPDGGYHVQRSGWGQGRTPYEDERQLIFDCGPVGESGHGHYDALHIEVSAGGRALLVDPGRYTYAEHGPVNWRQWFKGTAAHNTVCVDGLDQVPYRRGKTKGPVSQTRLLGRSERDGVMTIAGETVSPCYDAVHGRRVLFMDRRWWLIEDDLRAFSPHRYDLRFHLGPMEQDRVTVSGRRVDAPGLSLLIIEPADAVIAVEVGWVATDYGVRQPAPVISLTPPAGQLVGDVRFLTAIIPASPGQARPKIVSANSTRVEIANGGSTERVTLGAEPEWSQR